MAYQPNNCRLKPRPSNSINNSNIKTEWVCDECKIAHTHEQSFCVLCNKEQPTTTNLPNTQSNTYEIYKDSNRGLIQCNGDCGSEFSALMDNIVNNQNDNMDSSIISLRFRYFDDPLRQSLLKLMRKKALFTKTEYKQYYDPLDDKEYYVKDTTQVQLIMNLFKMLAKDNHIDILQQIAHQTCKEPSWSLLEQISYGKLYDLKDNYNSLKNSISIFENDIDNKKKTENQIVINALKFQAIKIEQEIKEEKQNVKEQKNLKSFLDKLQSIKTRKQYIKMQKQNSPLNDLEILAVLLYTDKDIHCYKMRRSHRNSEENSCKYSNLFYHLCSAIDKMWRIFHQNKKKEPQFLYHGNTVSYLSEKSQNKLYQKTVTSFTKDWFIAKEFANKIKYSPSDKKGMIWVIDNANEALVSGRLIGADVSWISKHSGESEYLISPITFNKFRNVSEQERKDNGWYISVSDHNMYITNNIQSMDMSLVTSDIDSKLDSPMLWIPSHIKGYEDMMCAFDKALSTIGALFGHFRRIECYECKVLSRIMDYTGKWSDLSIECPSCRALLFRSNKTDDRNRIIECFNSECSVKHITRLDLKKVKKNAQDGYKCIHCKQQQKITHLNNLASNHEKIEQTADRLLDDVQTLLFLNAKYTDGDVKEAEIDKEEYKGDLMKIISYLNKPENVNRSLFDIIKEFPVIWKWITSIKYVKLILDAYKDGYTNLLEEGVIDTSNDQQIDALLKFVNIGSTVENVIGIGTKFLQQFAEQTNELDEFDISEGDENNESDTNDNEISDDNDNESNENNNRVYYDCPQCSERVWVVQGFPQIICADCIQKKGIFSLFSFK